MDRLALLPTNHISSLLYLRQPHLLFPPLSLIHPNRASASRNELPLAAIGLAAYARKTVRPCGSNHLARAWKTQCSRDSQVASHVAYDACSPSVPAGCSLGLGIWQLVAGGLCKLCCKGWEAFGAVIGPRFILACRQIMVRCCISGIKMREFSVFLDIVILFDEDRGSRLKGWRQSSP